MVQNNHRRRNLLHNETNVNNKNKQQSNDDDQSINNDKNIGKQNNSKQQQQHKSMNSNVFSDDNRNNNNNNVNGILSWPIWLRKIMISMSIMFIIYIYHYHKDNQSLSLKTTITMASRHDNYLGSPIGKFIQCSTNDYHDDRIRFKQCTPNKCGRFVSDSIVNNNEALELRLFAQTIFTLIRPQGGVAIFDLASGALSNGTQFVNLYKLIKLSPNLQQMIKSKTFDTFHIVRKKLIQTISLTFGIESNHLYLTSPVFFTRIDSRLAKTLNDEYWHPHVDKFTYDSFHYTSLLYLSTYDEEFSGGRFIFMDEQKLDKKISNTTIEPKFGRVSFFTSGSENQHMVEIVSNGERFALTIPFTCDPNKQAILPTTI
uniref:2-oxoglutarate and iron-dependent oxygenase domain-containing protein 3-like n=1 Tax=Dermatophagoides pteronyssinus TaxID=6956 RepID=A0A6P6YJ27_DERPT|nr:2-oxoglutarate and iron-dependent oxygenase domain-containing protein 3-like [Dermatophagoides pteronyssinus]